MAKRRESIQAYGEEWFRCPKCELFLRRSDFSPRANTPSGIRSYCKACKRAEGRERASLPSVIETRRRWAQGAGREVQKRYRERFPGKFYAQALAQQAVASGQIARQPQCSVCDGDYRVEAHHDDYSKPLEVRWLCRLCHRAWHSEHGEAANAELPARWNGVNTARKAAKKARLPLVAEMRAAGKSQKEMAEHFGVTQSTICQDLKALRRE